jgi:tetratricopeptide (TPR) repeat protein
VVIYLVLLFSSVSYLKIRACQASFARFEANETGMFWSEAAVQYRYAKMIADGKRIPEYDQDLQYPEGVRPHETLTLPMEHVTGWSFRIYDRSFPQSVTLSVYVVLWACLFSSLSVVAIYAVALRVFSSHASAILASLLYGFCPATADRLVASFNREDFALPLLFGGFAFFVASLHSDSTFKTRLIWACFASMLFVAGLTAWHLTRFYLLTFGAAAAAAYLIARRESLKTFGLSLTIVTVSISIAGLAMPLLRTRQFVWSPAVILCVVTTASIAWNRTWQADDGVWKRLAVWLAIAAVPIVVLFAMVPVNDAYTYVWALLVEKVAHFGVKPIDPSRLSFDARMVWVEAFNSPSLAYVVGTCGAILLACVISSYRLVRFRSCMMENRMSLAMLLGMAGLFVFFFLMITRLSVFAIFFLSAMAGGAVCGRPTRRALLVTFAAIVPLVAVFAYGFPVGHSSYLSRLLGHREQSTMVKWPKDDELLVTWVKENTAENAVFLSRFGVAPVILAYADRAIVLQPKFESAGIRGKVRKSLEALYGTEEALAEFCVANGATHYLLDLELCLENDLDSPRYVADALRLSPATPAYQMQFAPERLSRFQLVYQNSFYRVFELVDSVESLQDFAYYPCYDIKRFGHQTGQEPFFDDLFTNVVLRDQLDAVARLRQGRTAHKLKQYERALRYFEEAIRRHPSLPGVHSSRGLSLSMVGRLEEALSEMQQEVLIHPGSPAAHFRLGLLRASVQDFDGALQSWHRCRELDPHYPQLEKVIAIAYGRGESSVADMIESSN